MVFLFFAFFVFFFSFILISYLFIYLLKKDFHREKKIFLSLKIIDEFNDNRTKLHFSVKRNWVGKVNGIMLAVTVRLAILSIEFSSYQVSQAYDKQQMFLSEEEENKFRC